MELRCWGKDGDPQGNLGGLEGQPRAAGGNEVKLGWVVGLGERTVRWGPYLGSLVRKDLPAPSALLLQNL